MVSPKEIESKEKLSSGHCNPPVFPLFFETYQFYKVTKRDLT